jgi:hypothetical protein
VNTRCSIEFYYILVDTIMVQDLVVCFFFQACGSSDDYMCRRCRKFHSTLCQCVLSIPFVSILQFFYHLVLVYEILLSPNPSCDIGVVVSLASFSTTNAAPYQQEKTGRAQRHSTRLFAFSLQTRNATSTDDITMHLATALFLGCILMARVSICWVMTRSRHINYNYVWPIRTNPKVVDLARLVAKALIPDQSMHRWCSQAAQRCLTRISW